MMLVLVSKGRGMYAVKWQMWAWTYCSGRHVKVRLVPME